MTAAEIAEVLGMALSTVSGVLKRIGLGKRSRLGAGAANRYERKRPGELVHMDIKKLGRISVRRGASRHAATAASQFKAAPKRLGAAGWEFVHVAVDDATRLAYAEVLQDERGATAVGLSATSGRVLRLARHHRRAAALRQRRLLPLARCTRSPVALWASATSSPALTGHTPTARRSASSAP